MRSSKPRSTLPRFSAVALMLTGTSSSRYVDIQKLRSFARYGIPASIRGVRPVFRYTVRCSLS